MLTFLLADLACADAKQTARRDPTLRALRLTDMALIAQPEQLESEQGVHSNPLRATRCLLLPIRPS